MTKRGRPRHSDILTPREWEVLVLLREGLTNDEIGGRLGITERTAKYHVSEILSKLGVESREEAAAWHAEERRPWWLAAGAPFAFFWRRAGVSWLSAAVSGGLVALTLGGLGVLLILLLRNGDGEAGPLMGSTEPEERIAFYNGGSIVIQRGESPDQFEFLLSTEGLGAGEDPCVGLGITWSAGTSVNDAATRLNQPGVYLVRPDGSGLGRLYGSGRALDAIAWAPSGDRFVLAVGCTSLHELYLDTPDGGELDPLASLPTNAGSLDWSPQGDAVAVTLSERLGIAEGALLIGIPHGAVTPIDGAQAFLGWSHDGTRYAIRSETSTAIVDATTGDRADLGGGIRRALWSPTDDRLAFSYVLSADDPTDPYLTSGIDVTQGDGTGRATVLPAEQVAQTGSATVWAWSPDGSRLLVQSGASPFHAFIYDLDGAAPPIDLGPTFKLANGVWSPDGGYIAVERLSAGSEATVELLAADDPVSTRHVFLGGITGAPQFSPDGSKLLFSERDPGNDAKDLYIAGVGVGAVAPRKLVDAGYGVLTASWSADGSWIAFVAGPVTADGCSG